MAVFLVAAVDDRAIFLHHPEVRYDLVGFLFAGLFDVVFEHLSLHFRLRFSESDWRLRSTG